MSIENIAREIRKINDYDDLMEIVKSAVDQWKAMFPDWEISTLSLPKGDLEGQKRILHNIIALCEKADRNRKAGKYTGKREESFRKNIILFEKTVDKQELGWYDNRARVGKLCACDAMMQEIAP